MNVIRSWSILIATSALVLAGCGGDGAGGGFSYSGARTGAATFGTQTAYWQEWVDGTLTRNIAELDETGRVLLTVEMAHDGVPVEGSFANTMGDAVCGGRLEDADTGQIWFAEASAFDPSDCEYTVDSVDLLNEETTSRGLLRSYALHGTFRIVLEPGTGASEAIVVVGDY